AYDYPLLGVFWTLFLASLFFLVIFTIIWALFDNFRRRDHSGWAKAGAVVAIAVIVGVAVGTPAGAATGDPPGRPAPGSHRDRRIGVSGGVVIASNETVNGPVVSVDGPAVINGVVTDKVYVGRGDARINGQVTGDVLVVDGDATVNGRVGGDVIAVLGRV